jgi:hypothetical protein
MTLLSLLSGMLAAADTDAISVATESAEAWLELVDDGDYDEAWDAGSTFLRGVIERGAYTNNLREVRAPHRLSARRIASVEPRTSFQDLAGLFKNLPDGKYLMFRFTSKARPARGDMRSRDISSRKPQDMVETLIMVEEAEGSWKPSFYFLTPGVIR